MVKSPFYVCGKVGVHFRLVHHRRQLHHKRFGDFSCYHTLISGLAELRERSFSSRIGYANTLLRNRFSVPATFKGRVSVEILDISANKIDKWVMFGTKFIVRTRAAHFWYLFWDTNDYKVYIWDNQNECMLTWLPWNNITGSKQPTNRQVKKNICYNHDHTN